MGKDCAVWRGIKGEEICVDEGDYSVVLAEAKPSHQAAALDEDEDEDEDSMVFSDGSTLAAEEIKTPVSQEPKNAPARSVWKNPDEQAATTPPSSVITSAPLALPAAAKIKGGTFYVIASFRGMGAAHRFSKKHARWTARVMKGTASGRTVFRVAVGPVEKRDYLSTRGRLIENGFKDAWALKISQPKVAVELAGLN